MTRIALVTGAAGFIGCHLVERLTADGWAVRGLDDERTGDWNRVKVSLDRIDRPLEEMSDADLRHACDGADVLYHLAAEKHNTLGVDANRMVAVNVAATSRLFAAAGTSGAPKIVFTSSLYAYGSMGPGAMAEKDIPMPSTIYGVSKLAGEHLLRVAERAHGVGWSIARLFFIFGPRQLAGGGYPSVIVRNFQRMRGGDPPIVNGDGTQALDYVYVDDCVDGLVRLADRGHDGLTVNLASGSSVTISKLTKAMLAVAGSTVMPVAGDADWTAGSCRWGTAALAAERLGWTASTPLESGLRRVWESMA